MIILSLTITALLIFGAYKLAQYIDKKAYIPPQYNPVVPLSIQELINLGALELGKNVEIDQGVWVGHPDNSGRIWNIKIGDNVYLRTGTVIYTDTHIGNNVKTGQHAVIRERCKIGDNTLIGTKVTVENDTIIGNNCSIETLSHITAKAKIHDGVFIGGFVGMTNDMSMNWKRVGHGKDLCGPEIKYGARIGSGAILLPAVVIGEYSVVNAGEIVRKDIPDKTMYFTLKGKSVYKKIKAEELNV